MNRKQFIALIAAAFCVLPAFVLGQDTEREKPEPFKTASLKKATGTVQAVSQSDRHVVLQVEGGRPVILDGQRVSNFDEVRPGDRVQVSYYEGLIAELKPPGKDTQGEVTRSQKTPGDMPGNASGRGIVTTVEVTSVDPDRNMITFEGPDGRSRTLGVADRNAKEFMNQLNPGDRVQMTYIEATAVTIEPEKG